MKASLHTAMSGQERSAWLTAVLVTGVGFGLLQWLVQRVPLAMVAEPWLTMWLELAVITVGVIMLLIGRTRGSNARKLPLSLSVVALFLTFIVVITLKPTRYTLDAISGDQGLYTAYVTKFAAESGNVDAIYAGLPAFYPPLYFYLLGRVAAAFAIEPYALLKWGLIAVTLAMPLLHSLLWRRLVDLPMAVAAAVALLFEQQWYKPAEWLTMVLFVPWWLYWVENVTEQRATSRGEQWRWWLGGGLLGALLFQGYYYWFFIGGLSLLVQVGNGLVSTSGRRTLRPLLANALPMLASSALFSSLYWGPYLYSMARSGGWQVLQNRWLAEGKIELPLPFAAATPAAGLLLLGLLALVVMAAEYKVARGLLYFLVAVYGWIGIGYIGMLGGMPVLSFRAYPLTTYIPAIGLAFGLIQLWQWTPTHSSLPQGMVSRVAAVLALVVVVYSTQLTVLRWLENEDVPKAVAFTYPAEQLAALDAAVPDGYREKTFLLSRGYATAIAHRPFYAFLAWSAHYSHPAAHFYARLDLLEKLTAVHSPELFAAALLHNRYARIDHLLLEPAAGGWRMSFLDDSFPDRNIQRELYFAATNLTEPYFAATAAGAWTVLTPQRAVDPLSTVLGKAGEQATAAQTALAYLLQQQFGQHLALPAGVTLPQVTEAQVQQLPLAALPLPILADLHQVVSPALRPQVVDALLANVGQPLPEVLMDQRGVAKLQLLGTTYTAATTEKPATIEIDLIVLAKPDWDYQLWFHAQQSERTVTLDFAPLRPTSTWETGQVIRLVHPLPLEAGTYALSFGFWRSAEDVRLVTAAWAVETPLGTVVIE